MLSSSHAGHVDVMVYLFVAQGVSWTRISKINHRWLAERLMHPVFLPREACRPRFVMAISFLFPFINRCMHYVRWGGRVSSIQIRPFPVS